jgi:spore coat protein CotF
MTKKLENALGLTPMPLIQPKDPQNQALVNQEQIDTDLSIARENTHNALDVAKRAVEDVLVIATQSQHPKAYEALNSVLKTYADIASNLADLQLKKQRLQPKNDFSGDENSPTTINNLFVGSTAELSKMLEDLRKNKEDE